MYIHAYMNPRGKMKQALFDHVSDNGDLILRLGNEEVVLQLSEDLEQGIMLSHQIQTENRAGDMPPKVATMPISAIQEMSRQGYTYEYISEKCHIDQALIRRLTKVVEQEKKSALHQFFYSIKSRDNNHRIKDIIYKKFTFYHIDPTSVAWDATRNKREPWKITAHFTYKNRECTAAWSWSMITNSSTEAIHPLDDNADFLLHDRLLPTPSLEDHFIGHDTTPTTPDTEKADNTDKKTPLVDANTADATTSTTTTATSSLSETPTPASAETSSSSHSSKRTRMPSWDEIMFGTPRTKQ